MNDTSERVRQVKLRVELKKRKKGNRFVGTFTCLSGILFVSLVSAVGRLTGNSGAAVQGMNGATMILEGAGGYVLVGVIAFVLAVVLTLICIRYHKKDTIAQGKNEERDD